MCCYKCISRVHYISDNLFNKNHLQIDEQKHKNTSKQKKHCKRNLNGRNKNKILKIILKFLNHRLD